MTGSLNMVGYGLAAIGPGIGIGLIFAAYIALAEALAIIGIALAFVLN
jgi:F-type H+-transporting ATPase subunit c